MLNVFYINGLFETIISGSLYQIIEKKVNDLISDMQPGLIILSEIENKPDNSKLIAHLLFLHI